MGIQSKYGSPVWIYNEFTKKYELHDYFTDDDVYLERRLPARPITYKEAFDVRGISYLISDDGDSLLIYDSECFEEEIYTLPVIPWDYDVCVGYSKDSYTAKGYSLKTIEAAKKKDIEYDKIVYEIDTVRKAARELIWSIKSGIIWKPSFCYELRDGVYTDIAAKIAMYHIRCIDEDGNKKLSDDPYLVILVNCDKIRDGQVDVIVPKGLDIQALFEADGGWQYAVASEVIGAKINFVDEV